MSLCRFAYAAVALAAFGAADVCAQESHRFSAD